MKRIILIGGAPATGKSRLAQDLSKKLGIPWISTDTIREFMKAVVDTKRHEKLFRFENTTAKKTKLYTPTERVDNQNQESEEVWNGVLAFIKSNYVWEEYIIEGVAITPAHVKKAKIPGVKLVPAFLIEQKPYMAASILYHRDIWEEPRKLLTPKIKQSEVAGVLQFSVWLERECEKYGYTPVPARDLKALMKAVH